MKESKIAKELLPIFPTSLKEKVEKSLHLSDVTELRLRVGLPLLVRTNQGEFFLSKEGKQTDREENACLLTSEEMKITFQRISQYSVFAHKEELKEGFLTLKGGHRIGLCGRGYFDGEGKRQFSQISSMNIRIARQVPGCSVHILPYLRREDSFCHTLIISPPGGGKTTFLRDLITQISDGGDGFCGKNISVVDERSEIGNRTRGGEGFYLGKRTDLLDHCPKAEGMLLLLRTMTPEVLAADEIGGREDIEALKYIRNCGCKLLVTVHGSHILEVQSRPILKNYLLEYPFDRYVVICTDGKGSREAAVYDEKQILLGRERL